MGYDLEEIFISIKSGYKKESQILSDLPFRGFSKN